jgi:hypothetical protein
MLIQKILSVMDVLSTKIECLVGKEVFMYTEIDAVKNNIHHEELF